MPEEEMMTKLYKAQIYYDKNMNSQYSSLNSLLIVEFWRKNKWNTFCFGCTRKNV
jgi:hypothetical protein